MEISVNQTHSWVLSYDCENGLKDVVFHTFSQKPSAEEIIRATKVISTKNGCFIYPRLWIRVIRGD